MDSKDSTSKAVGARTEVNGDLPMAYPFVLHVRKYKRRDAAPIARGDMLDLNIGVPSFDGRFRVEGAPAEVVRRVLTDEVQTFLFATNRVRIATKEGWLMVCLPGLWPAGVDDVRPAVQCVAAMVTSVRATWLALDEATPMAHARKMVYRGIPDDAPLREARAAREAEVQHVENLRRRRSGLRWRFWEPED